MNDRTTRSKSALIYQWWNRARGPFGPACWPVARWMPSGPSRTTPWGDWGSAAESWTETP